MQQISRSNDSSKAMSGVINSQSGRDSGIVCDTVSQFDNLSDATKSVVSNRQEHAYTEHNDDTQTSESFGNSGFNQTHSVTSTSDTGENRATYFPELTDQRENNNMNSYDGGVDVSLVALSNSMTDSGFEMSLTAGCSMTSLEAVGSEPTKQMDSLQEAKSDVSSDANIKNPRDNSVYTKETCHDLDDITGTNIPTDNKNNDTTVTVSGSECKDNKVPHEVPCRNSGERRELKYDDEAKASASDLAKQTYQSQIQVLTISSNKPGRGELPLEDPPQQKDIPEASSPPTNTSSRGSTPPLRVSPSPPPMNTVASPLGEPDADTGEVPPFLSDRDPTLPPPPIFSICGDDEEKKPPEEWSEACVLEMKILAKAEPPNGQVSPPERCDSQLSSLSEKMDICRICHCEGEDNNRLISPCLCAGSLKYVHLACVQKWIKSSDKKSCELCNFDYIMTTKTRPFKQWEKLEMTSAERRKIVCSVTFHIIAITCVIWSLYVLIDRTTEEVHSGSLDWPFWTKLIVVAIGFTGGLVFMYVQCKMYAQLCFRWRAFNKLIQIENAPEDPEIRAEAAAKIKARSGTNPEAGQASGGAEQVNVVVQQDVDSF